MAINQLSAQDLAEWLADSARARPQLIDVREPGEFEHCHIEGAKLIPMQSVPARLGEIEPGGAVVLICHHGNRSQRVAQFLERQGYARVSNLVGGVAAWARDVDPSMPTY